MSGTSFSDWEAAARAGDAEAAYRLSGALHGSGRHAEAAAYLEKAARAGHPGALYTHALQQLPARPTRDDGVRVLAQLEEAARRGAVGARLKRAVLIAFGLGAQRSWPAAVEEVVAAAHAGYPPAWREIGALALFGGDARGGALIAAAAERGDRLAQALGIGDAASLHGVDAIAASLGGLLARTPLAPETLHAAPSVLKLRGVLSPFERRYLMAAMTPRLARSAVVDSSRAEGVEAGFRTSQGAVAGLLDLDLPLFALQARAAAAAGLAQERCEFMGVLRYRPGEEYRPHHDYLPEDAADYSEVRRAGQRVATLLVSLNEGYEGGATAFPRLSLSHRGAAGDAVLFENASPEGAVYPDSLHAGEPVAAGEKWMLTIWARARRFWVWD